MAFIGPLYAPSLFETFRVDDLNVDDIDIDRLDVTGDIEKAVKDALERAKLYIEQWGEQHGLKVVIKRSKDYSRRCVYLGCSLGGKPRRQSERNRCRSSDKIDCLFSAVITYARGVWILSSSCAEHNHGPSFPQEKRSAEGAVGKQEPERPKKRQRRLGQINVDGGSFINYQLSSQ